MTDAPTPRDVLSQAIDAFPGKLHSEKITAILSALTAAGYTVEQGWQPIATAPRDKMLMLGHVEDAAPTIGYYARGAWREHNGKGTPTKPTHWRPLPAGPTGAPA